MAGRRVCTVPAANKAATAAGAVKQQAGLYALPTAASRKVAVKQIMATLSATAHFLFSAQQSARPVPFAPLDMAQPGEVFEAIISRMVEPVHRRLCTCLAIDTGENPESHDVKLTVLSMISQMPCFRLGQAEVAMWRGVHAIGPSQTAAFAAVTIADIAAFLNLLGDAGS